MIEAIIFLIFIAVFFVCTLPGINNRNRYDETLKFMLDHPDADKVMGRASNKCPKCGGHKRLSQVVCEECSRDGRE